MRSSTATIRLTSPQTLGLLGAAAALFATFLLIESRISSPLVPLGLFRNRNVSTANTIGILMAAGMFAYFFFSALYLQLVLEYSLLEVGLAYLPGTVVGCVVAAAFRPAGDALRDQDAATRGPRADDARTCPAGARSRVDGSWATDVLPATLAVGLGAGIAFNPILLAAMSGVMQEQAGLRLRCRQHLVHDGRRVGLAVLASLADRRTDEPSLPAKVSSQG